MGTVTKSITKTNSGLTGVFTFTCADEFVITGSTFTFQPLMPTSAKVKLTRAGMTEATSGFFFRLRKDQSSLFQFDNGGWVSWSSGATKALTITAMSGATNTRQTSSYFNASNASERRVEVQYYISSVWADTTNSSGDDVNIYDTSTFTLSQTLVLDAPPTFSTTGMSFDMAQIYAGLTTASVSVSALSAKYGGDISEVKLTIGNQSVTRADAGTLSILLESAGTFTPTVSVTDSRGQVTTKSLDAITVNGYTEPSVSFNVQRTTSTGVPNDEGTYGTLSASFTFTDVVAQLTQPTVKVDGTTASVTWYSTRATDGTLSGSVNWSSLTSSATVYGIVSAPNIQTSYQIEVTPNDSISSGTPITQTLASAFYTIDFLAGGHGIAFGQPATQDGFECNMPTTFHDTVTMEDAVSVMDANSTLRALFDFIHPVGSYYETSDTSFDPNTTWGGTWSSETITDDVIVEEGTSGTWTYRKWSSGIAECWGTYSYTPTKWNAWGSLYEAIGSSYIASYPTGLFSERPLSVTAVRADSRGLLIETFTTGTKDHTDGHVGVRPNSSATLSAISFDVHAIGHWKTYTAPTTIYRWHRTA